MTGVAAVGVDVSEPVGRCGAVFDGRFVYMPQKSVSASITGAITRYDTQSAFTDLAAWSTFDVATTNPKARGFAGANFDGRSLYLVPAWFGNGQSFGFYDGVTARYDTKADFFTAASWQTFDTSSKLSTATTIR